MLLSDTSTLVMPLQLAGTTFRTLLLEYVTPEIGVGSARVKLGDVGGLWSRSMFTIAATWETLPAWSLLQPKIVFVPAMLLANVYVFVPVVVLQFEVMASASGGRLCVSLNMILAMPAQSDTLMSIVVMSVASVDPEV